MSIVRSRRFRSAVALAFGHDTSSMARDGSGTAWLPDETPMYAIHATRRSWICEDLLLLHGESARSVSAESGDEPGDDAAKAVRSV